MHQYIYIYSLPIEGYGDATSQNITEIEITRKLFSLLKDDMGIHEAGFQDPADVQIGPA